MENFENASENQIRTPISQMNFGIALPKIDIKQVNEKNRSKSQVRGSTIQQEPTEGKPLNANLS